MTTKKKQKSSRSGEREMKRQPTRRITIPDAAVAEIHGLLAPEHPDDGALIKIVLRKGIQGGQPTYEGDMAYHAGVVHGVALALHLRVDDVLRMAIPRRETKRGPRARNQEWQRDTGRARGWTEFKTGSYLAALDIAGTPAHFENCYRRAVMVAHADGVRLALLPEELEVDLADRVREGDLPNDLDFLAGYRVGWVEALFDDDVPPVVTAPAGHASLGRRPDHDSTGAAAAPGQPLAADETDCDDEPAGKRTLH